MTIPFIVADLGLSANQSAKLLVAFFPGYVITQIPEGMLAEIVGGKGRSFPSAEGNGLPFRRGCNSSGKADRRQEGQNVSFCNVFGNGLMLVHAPLAAAAAASPDVNAMAVAFFAAGTWPLGTCSGPTFASRDI